MRVDSVRALAKIRPFRWLLAPVAVGMLVRCHGLSYQVAGGDEFHAIRTALALPLERILVTYRPSDNCIPLTALFRLLMDAGVEVSELHLRLPILVCGFLVLIVVPLWAAARAGRSTAVILAWLLAVSPLLVHYSRMIRSYMPIVLFGGGAVIAFEHWCHGGKRRSAALYVVFGALAIYFHLGATPFVLSPFLFYAGAKILKRPADLPPWRSAILTGCALAAACLTFLVPARKSLITLIDSADASFSTTLKTIGGVAALQSGTGTGLLVTLFWLLALRGLVALWHDRPRFAIYSLVLLAGQVAGLLILSTRGMHQATIFNRYLLITMPIVLLWLAAGLALPWRTRTTPLARRAQGAMAVAFIAALVFSGPLAEREFWDSPFVIRPDSLRFFLQRDPPQVSIPAVYHRLAPDHEGPIIEYPWHTTWRFFSSALVRYQEVHGRKVIVAPMERLLWDRRLGFRNMVPPLPEPILASRAAYLVWHLDPMTEDRAVDGHHQVAKLDARAARHLQREQRQLELLNHQAKARVDSFVRLWGPPDYEADAVKVWDLDRLRRTDRSHAAEPLRTGGAEADGLRLRATISTK